MASDPGQTPHSATATPPPSTARPYLTVAVVYVCCVGGLLAIVQLCKTGQPLMTGFVLTRLVFLFTAVLAFVMLGRDSIGQVFGRRATGMWLAIGPAIGLLCYGINLLWFLLSARMEGITVLYLGREVSFWTVVAGPLLVAYTEELVFRGVLWTALAKVSSSSIRPLIQTSVLFALIHLVNRGGFYELPHRFVSGLLLGWLRLKSGSLLPSVHAHFVVLALATVD